jgi:hypothetical protein
VSAVLVRERFAELPQDSLRNFEKIPNEWTVPVRELTTRQSTFFIPNIPISSPLATTSNSLPNKYLRKTVINRSSSIQEQWALYFRIPLLLTLSTDIKLAIFQLVAILFGMRLGAFFLAWLCANHLDKAPPMGVLCSLTIGLARKPSTHIKSLTHSALSDLFIM